MASIAPSSTQHDQSPPPQYSEKPPLSATQHSQPTTAVVIVEQPMNRGPIYGKTALTMDCPLCAASITSTTQRKCGLFVWMMCGIIVFWGLVVFPPILLGCCFIPFCIPSFYDTQHSCPHCKQVMGTHKPYGSHVTL